MSSPIRTHVQYKVDVQITMIYGGFFGSYLFLSNLGDLLVFGVVV